jgi:hypothetical protein
VDRSEPTSSELEKALFWQCRKTTPAKTVELIASALARLTADERDILGKKDADLGHHARDQA